MKRVLILYNRWSGKCITGGQFYEDNMYHCMLENPEIAVERFAVNRKPSFFNKLFAPLLNLQYFNKCKKNDIVIFNSVVGWYFMFLAFSLKLLSYPKVIIIHHHFMYQEFSGIRCLFYKILEHTFLSSSNILVTVSPYIYDLCKCKFPNKNIRLWPIPFSDIIIDCQKEVKSGQLVFTGTIEPRKGLIYLINALAILKHNNTDISLNIIGKIKDQKYYEDLIKVIDRNKLQVNFLGFINSDEKDRILKGSDIFVFPSLLEGYGMVLREVMSYGLPIVCFNNSAMPYLVEDGINGIVVDNKNHIKLAESILKILKDRNLRQRLSQGAYNSTKKTITLEKYKDLLRIELHNI